MEDGDDREKGQGAHLDLLEDLTWSRELQNRRRVRRERQKEAASGFLDFDQGGGETSWHLIYFCAAPAAPALSWILSDEDISLRRAL